MDKHLIFVGGGHAHLTCLKNMNKFIEAGLRVSVISPSKYQYYSGMGPGLLSGIYSPEEARFNIQEITQRGGGNFIEDKVINLDPKQHLLHLKSGKKVSYDIASFNIGSKIDLENIEIKESEIIPLKPIVNLLDARKDIETESNKESITCTVIGGGAAGVEIAGNLWRLGKKNNMQIKILLLSNRRILIRYPLKVRKKALDSLRKRNIAVKENLLVKEIIDNAILSNQEKSLKSDYIFVATGVRIAGIFERASLSTTDDGAMLVNLYLQSIDYPNLFGGGDCIDLNLTPLDKVGVYAVRENPILLDNILAYSKGKELREFKPQEKYLLILNMGNGKGIAWKGKYVLRSKLAFKLKNYIDKRFMRKFQL